MALMRGYLALCLALLVAVTSQQLAVARGQPHAAGQVELCVGADIIIVSVDEDGNPTGPAHFCPDLVMAFATTLAADLPDLRLVLHSSRVAYSVQETRQSSLIHIESHARGPPLFV